MEKNPLIIDSQIGIFFKDSIKRPDELISIINGELDGVFDQMPIILPVPPDINFIDVPIVTLNSSNGEYTCTIAQSRLDFYIKGIGKQGFSDIKTNFLEKSNKILNKIKKDHKLKRLAFINRFFIKEDKDSEVISELIVKKFKRLQGETNIYSTTVQYSTRETFNDIVFNNFTLIQPSITTIKNLFNHVKGVLITRDFNTIPENDYSETLSKDVLGSIMDWSESKFNIDKILEIIWPIKVTQVTQGQ
ncbi:MAG: hypothetical protein WC741_04725 [Patescibacteria group bacterium]|jgi:hypothetical protein